MHNLIAGNANDLQAPLVVGLSEKNQSRVKIKKIKLMTTNSATRFKIGNKDSEVMDNFCL